MMQIAQLVHHMQCIYDADSAARASYAMQTVHIVHIVHIVHHMACTI